MPYDVAIIGSGFAGSILARVLHRQGRRVLLIEKGRHPRFAIGESTTPLANFALERLAQRYRLPDLRHLSTWGGWRQRLPQLRCGLKRGFTFYRHAPGRPYANSAANEARLLVAASPSAEIADTHWLREDVDHHLVKRAIAEGVDYFDETELDGLEIGSQVRLFGQRSGERVVFSAEYLVDASGPAGFLASRQIASVTDRVKPKSALLFSHFEKLGSFVEFARAQGAVLEPGPYPDEKAAVHHLLDGGWMYVLPFDHGSIASCGIVVMDPAEETLDPAAAWDAFLDPYPTLRQQFAQARPTRAIRRISRIQHRLETAVGERFFLLPHTFAFFEPLFSTGMAWSLLAVERLATLFEGTYGDADAYGELLGREAERIEQLIEGAYLVLSDFERFVALSHLYFVTVSFTELRQRLLSASPDDVPFAWQGFLGVGDPVIDEVFHDLPYRLSSRDFAAWSAERLAPRNVAGLADPARRNLYPVDLDVLVDRCALLGLERAQVLAALPRLRSGNPPRPPFFKGGRRTPR